MRLIFTNFIIKHIRLCTVIFIIDFIYVINVYNAKVLAVTPNNEPRFGEEMKYILQWSRKTYAPFNFMGEGNAAFVKNSCKYQNCYVTDDPLLLNVTDFDAIVFNGRNVIKMEPSQLPKIRSPKQKYIFAGTESADRFPACNKDLDNFFNWTWTYKLSSDFRFGYITIYDLEGKEVGPATDMKWPEYMEPIEEDLKQNLSSKSKAAVTFISDCKTNSKREDFIEKLNKELKVSGFNVDVYGSCGEFTCIKKEFRVCNKKIQDEYYFYLAFENSFAEDYVTEKLLTALNNYAVPVVFGGAEYSRFLPPGSYLDARKLGPKNLARIMNELIADKGRYYDFFRWRNHFTFKQTLMNADICKLCEVLNDERKVNTVSVWKDFRRWWNGASPTVKCW